MAQLIAAVPTPARAGAPHGASQPGNGADAEDATMDGKAAGTQGLGSAPGSQPAPRQMHGAARDENENNPSNFRLSDAQMRAVIPMLLIGWLQHEDAIGELMASTMST